MKIGCRVPFKVLKTLDKKRSKLLNYPIELALPISVEEFEETKFDIETLLPDFLINGIDIHSIHAPHMWLRHESAEKMIVELGQLATAANASVVTFHPENLPSAIQKDKQKAKTLKNNIAKMFKEKSIATGIIFSIETFGGKRRLFSYKEIVSQGLFMTLDTTHVADTTKCETLIESYGNMIPVIHLSEWDTETEERHLPIGEWSTSFIKRLKANSWDGCIVLEYMPDYHNLYAEDIAHLVSLL